MQVENLGVLITLFGQALRTLALTSDDLHSLSSRSNKDASRCRFLTTWSPNPSQCKLLSNMSANEIQHFGQAGQSQQP